jgi:hypothetical protein
MIDHQSAGTRFARSPSATLSRKSSTYDEQTKVRSTPTVAEVDSAKPNTLSRQSLLSICGDRLGLRPLAPIS